MTVFVLVRHAVAVRRHDWDGADRYRPLSSRGLAQAAALAPALTSLRPVRVLSSPATRCVQTVEPLATSSGLGVEEVEELFEGSGTDALDLVLSTGREGAVVACSHGDVLPELLRSIAGHLRHEVPPDPSFAKGAAWVVDETGARYLAPQA